MKRRTRNRLIGGLLGGAIALFVSSQVLAPLEAGPGWYLFVLLICVGSAIRGFEFGSPRPGSNER